MVGVGGDGDMCERFSVVGVVVDGMDVVRMMEFVVVWLLVNFDLRPVSLASLTACVSETRRNFRDFGPATTAATADIGKQAQLHTITCREDVQLSRYAASVFRCCCATNS